MGKNGTLAGPEWAPRFPRPAATTAARRRTCRRPSGWSTTRPIRTLAQLAVQAAWRSCGLGTTLIRAAEQRILARGLDRAEPGGGVQPTSPRVVRAAGLCRLRPQAGGVGGGG